MLILVYKFSHTVGGLLWVGFGVMWSGLGVSNWGGRCKTFLLPIPYVWEIRPALLGLGRSYLIFKVTDHRSPITDHRSPITDHRRFWSKFSFGDTLWVFVSLNVMRFFVFIEKSMHLIKKKSFFTLEKRLQLVKKGNFFFF